MVLNGPNLNLLGTREPEVYGATTLDDIAQMLTDQGDRLGIMIDLRQSNHEGHLIDWLHEAGAKQAIAVKKTRPGTAGRLRTPTVKPA